jgi:nicotinic acid mononucleotide adenylyltransferase
MNYLEAFKKYAEIDTIRLYVMASGAGAGIQKRLWETPGASRYLIGACFPYEKEDTERELGFEPEKYCSEETAIDLALEAYYRALGKESMTEQRFPVGLGVTASVTSNREHKGRHHAYVCVVTPSQVIGTEVILPKGELNMQQRMGDGETVDMISITFLQRVIDGREGTFVNDVEEADWSAHARKRFFDHPQFLPSGLRDDWGLPLGSTIFPGSFNPPHTGHWGISRTVQRVFGSAPIFNICATPPHKEALTVQMMLSRAKMLEGEHVIFTQNDSTFLSKARVRPGSKFVIGADTLIRMMDEKWGHPIGPMLEEFLSLGTTFLVFGRECEDGYKDSELIVNTVDVKYRNMFLPVIGRWDVSSSQFRKRNMKAT